MEKFLFRISFVTTDFKNKDFYLWSWKINESTWSIIGIKINPRCNALGLEIVSNLITGWERYFELSLCTYNKNVTSFIIW